MWLQRAVNNHFSKASYTVRSVVTRVGKHSNSCTNGQEHSGVYLIMYITQAYCANNQYVNTAVKTATRRNIRRTTTLVSSYTSFLTSKNDIKLT